MPACYLGNTRIYAVLDSRSQETKMTWLRALAYAWAVLVGMSFLLLAAIYLAVTLG